ncbi:MAG: HPr(Ser) kinase/phosphatase [Candidatus Aminicenantes bacterium]|nr:MAG: HPr(Ser) kinase/phosphatase [Candidatus Aminicenantes bacterium]
MISDKELSLEVKDFFQKTKEPLKLIPVSGRIGFSRKTALSHQREDRLPIQLWGKKDFYFLKNLSSLERKTLTKRKLGEETLCVIQADGLRFFPEVIEEARKIKLPLFMTELSQKKCREGLKNFFLSFSSQQIKISAGLLQIFGLGVLIIGDSGIGKSESALELVSRGYRFVCDDVVLLQKKANNKLVGAAPPLSRNFMEIRGLGIINIKEIFGPKSVLKQSRVDLIIRLTKYQKKGKEPDRLGFKFREDYLILGVKIPQINLPVAPGRNIATLIEVACKVHVLREKGYFAPQDIVKKLDRVLSAR